MYIAFVWKINLPTPLKWLFQLPFLTYNSIFNIVTSTFIFKVKKKKKNKEKGKTQNQQNQLHLTRLTLMLTKKWGQPQHLHWIWAEKKDPLPTEGNPNVYIHRTWGQCNDQVPDKGIHNVYIVLGLKKNDQVPTETPTFTLREPQRLHRTWAKKKHQVPGGNPNVYFEGTTTFTSHLG